MLIYNQQCSRLSIYPHITYKFTHQEHIFDQDRTENLPLAPLPILSLSLGTSSPF